MRKLSARPAARRARRRGRPDPAFSARTQILIGAAEAFGRNGYADTSVEDVLRAAGVSRRTFYRFFRNKDDVFAQLYETATLLFVQAMRNAIAIGDTPEQKLRNAIDTYLRAPEDVGPVFGVLMTESSRPGTPLYERRQAVIDELVSLFADDARAHRGRDIDPLIVRGIIAAAERIALHVFCEAPGDPSLKQRARRALLHIASAALSPPDGEGDADGAGDAPAASDAPAPAAADARCEPAAAREPDRP